MPHFLSRQVTRFRSLSCAEKKSSTFNIQADFHPASQHPPCGCGHQPESGDSSSTRFARGHRSRRPASSALRASSESPLRSGRGSPAFSLSPICFPASSPARTKLVFLLTLPLTFPPRAIMISAISSRGWLSVPVMTQVVPLIVESRTSPFAPRLADCNTARRNRAIISRFPGFAEKKS